MLAEGFGVQEISRELEKQGTLVPWTKVRARAAVLGRTKASRPKVADTTEDAPTEPEERPDPVSMSRKELDLRIWDMWRAGKTLEEISDILYSKGLYYSPKSVRVRLLSQGAKL